MTANDLILYNLGIGFSQDPAKEEDYQFTYEQNDPFNVFPIFPATLACINLMDLMNCKGLPEFNFMKMLHGEEIIEFMEPVQPNETLISEDQILDMDDKKKFGKMIFEANIKNEKGELKARIIRSLIFRDLGGFGVSAKVKPKIPKIPQRDPDQVVSTPTYASQAILYRLSGDINPLHIDPNMAAVGGFDKPILHGMCTFGFTMRVAF